MLRVITTRHKPNPRIYSSACRPRAFTDPSSIYRTTLPSLSTWALPTPLHHGACGEGSWNVGWDSRPARWMLFRVCACPVGFADVDSVGVRYTDGNLEKGDVVGSNEDLGAKYTIIEVKSDGRCLFRAIAHVACLRKGEEAPDENHQRELADDLRAQVVAELVKRRKETEWFIDEDFDVYVNRIQQPYVWGGEPELLMASHVLKTPISVFQVDKSSGKLRKTADYGEEYKKVEAIPITILFHRYGHYDILDLVPEEYEIMRTQFNFRPKERHSLHCCFQL